MRFAVFCYDFPHWKTQTGLFSLHVNGLTPEIVVGAPWKELNIRNSQRRITHKGLYLENPVWIASSCGFPYTKIPHEEYFGGNLDFGIILGARILPKSVIDSFRYGIINLHPGLLPDNRGLDNVKWAVKRGIPQGVTAHWINEYVDSGLIIKRDTVPVYHDDTLLDVQFRVQNKEIEMLVPVIEQVEKCVYGCDSVPSDNNTQKCLTPEEESTLDDDFIRYKERYAVN